jgi:hypothetical protein
MDKVPNHREVKIAQLARTFPCLRNAPGIEPWNANWLDDWAASGGPSHGEKCSARFILAVWNPDRGRHSSKFDLMEALRIWDIQSHNAFLAWASDPWWA